MRWLDPEVTVAPAFEPIALDQAKAAQRIDGADEDTLLATYLAAARSIVEDRTGLALATQTVVLRAWGFDCPTFVLPLAPVQEITSITYLDGGGVRQTLSTDVYSVALYGKTPMVSLKYGQTWPSHRCELGSIEITCVAGYAADAAPEPCKQAVLVAFGDFHVFREQAQAGAISDVASVAIDNLLINHRRSFI